MKKNLFVTVTLAVVLAFSMAVVGCSNPAGGGSGNSNSGNGGTNPGGNTANPFVGTWVASKEYGTITYTFNADMSLVYTVAGYTETITGTYTVSGNTAIITFTGVYAGMKQGFVISGNSLYAAAPLTKKSGNGTSANPLAGTTWGYEYNNSTMTFTFNADMTYVMTYDGESQTGTYTVSGNTVIMQYEGGEETSMINGNTLFAGIDYNSPLTKR